MEQWGVTNSSREYGAEAMLLNQNKCSQWTIGSAGAGSTVLVFQAVA